MKKVLVITYYWPPSGGSGVQRWMYFCRYLSNHSIKPIVLTVNEKKASYRNFDYSLQEHVKHIEVHKTNTREPLKLYSRILSGDSNKNIPHGFSESEKITLFQKLSRFIRGNFFIPDARKGWVRFALKEAINICNEKKIDWVITTGPPHSSHLIGLKLKKRVPIKWIADFRDPWSELYYNKFLYRTNYAIKKDKRVENLVLNRADSILTIGPSMKKHLIEKSDIKEDKVHYVYNGYDQNLFDNCEPKAINNKFEIVHVGVLGENQPITSFLKALRRICDNNIALKDRIVLKLVGNVSQKTVKEIKVIIPYLEVELTGYVDHSMAIKSMLNANLLLNSFAEMKNSSLLISGKLMEYIATGNPILGLGDENGDAAALLKGIKYAAVIDRKNDTGIYEFLNTLFNKYLENPNKRVETNSEHSLNYTRQKTTENLANILEQFLQN